MKDNKDDIQAFNLFGLTLLQFMMLLATFGVVSAFLINTFFLN